MKKGRKTEIRNETKRNGGKETKETKEETVRHKSINTGIKTNIDWTEK